MNPKQLENKSNNTTKTTKGPLASAVKTVV